MAMQGRKKREKGRGKVDLTRTTFTVCQLAKVGGKKRNNKQIASTRTAIFYIQKYIR